MALPKLNCPPCVCTLASPDRKDFLFVIWLSLSVPGESSAHSYFICMTLESGPNCEVLKVMTAIPGHLRVEEQIWWRRQMGVEGRMQMAWGEKHEAGRWVGRPWDHQGRREGRHNPSAGSDGHFQPLAVQIALFSIVITDPKNHLHPSPLCMPSPLLVPWPVTITTDWVTHLIRDPKKPLVECQNKY